MKTLNSLGIYLIILAYCFILSNCSLLPDYRIQVDGEILVERRGEEIIPSSPIVTDLENPVINGFVLTSGGSLREWDSRRGVWCCNTDDFRLTTDGDYFKDQIVFPDRKAPFSYLGMRNRFADRRSGGVLYGFTAFPIHLPMGGTPVQLNLQVSGEVMITGEVRLDPDVIVLPVHLHVFKGEEEEIGNMNALMMGLIAAFDKPNIKGRFGLIGDGLSFITNTYDSPHYNVDDIWRQAKIQFRVERFEVIRQDEGLERDLLTVEETPPEGPCFGRRSLRFYPYHCDRIQNPGIHIYFGRNLADTSIGGISDVGGFACAFGSTCSGGVKWDNYILIGERYGIRNVLAHELGHFLGLQHTNERGACGGRLIEEGTDDPNENLMLAGDRSRDNTVLTAQQIAWTRRIAQSYLDLWSQPFNLVCNNGRNENP